MAVDVPSEGEEIGRDAHVSIEMVTSIQGMLESLPFLSRDCCIYKVPKRLREVNLKRYTPLVVSIGPFHRTEEHLQAMENHKLRYLQTFLIRTGSSLEDCLDVVKTWEESARHRYAETIELSSDEFVKMILVDGSFIVELLLRSHFPQLIHESDRIFHKPWMGLDVDKDMLLLENQLPFFVLESLFDLVPPTLNFLGRKPSFLELTHKRFKKLLKIIEPPNTITRPTILHFVDFIRCCYLSSIRNGNHQGGARFEFSPTVTKLHEAGIKFKKGTSGSLLDIKFSDGILEIPQLPIDDVTETLFRNLIAFEQCHCKDDYIIQYMHLLDEMINTPKDVDLLIHHEIITSTLGNSEHVSTLFNDICKEVTLNFEKFYFSSLCENLNAYCRTPWHNWKATLKHDYFNTPWAIISFVAAVVLLLLTFLQTVFSGLSL